MKLRKLAVWYRNYFGFSQTETRVLQILLPILFAVVFIHASYRDRLYLYPLDANEEQLLLDSLYNLFMEKENRLNSEGADKPPTPLTGFNPNDVDLKWLLDHGVNQRVANNWVKYLKSGGKFRDVGQLQKVYGMTDSLFLLLKPFVRIEARAVDRPSVVTQKQDRMLDLNKVDTTSLRQVRGIGSTLSRRIVLFRDRLGGFVSKDQLYEVYHLDSSVIENLFKKFNISAQFVPRKIYLNKVTEENLARHPYVSYQEAKLVIAYRSQHGNFTSLEQLLEIPVISRDKLEKLDPYLTLEDE